MLAAPHRERYCQVDLLDELALSACLSEIRPQAVVHLAAITHVEHSEVRAFYDVNVVGTRNLLAALAGLDAPPRHVLIASSANVYGNSAGGQLQELSETNPANDYAVSKLAMEFMAKLWAQNFPITIVRPFNYTGVGQSDSFLLPKIVNHFKRNAEVVELGNMDIGRDFCDVRDVVTAYRELLESEHTETEIINVCSGRLVTLGQILDAAREISGNVVQAVSNPELIRINEVQTLYGDSSKLKRILGGWEPRPFEETLRWMFAYESGEIK